ncbi:EF-hand domain-containing protein [Hirschfeldia incana]|nr:EF-hand domain-containing protein [Hirschfeldia incana]
MERPVSFDVTDYNPEGDDWTNDLLPHIDSMSGPSSPPIHQNPEMRSPEDANEYVTITLDIRGDNVVVEENSEPMVRRRQGSSRKKSVVNRRRTLDEPSRSRFDSSEALKGLKMFISMTDAGWIAVERRFDKMTANTGGLLDPLNFGECLGINSNEFALELFYTLARQREISCEGISKSELLELWCHINDQCFDSRIRMFFDMADKDNDGRLSEEEVKQFIRLTASANNQSTTQDMVDKCAAMIMKELDPHNFEYIMLESLEVLMLDVETHTENKILTNSVETKKLTTKRWYKVIRDIPSSSLIPCLKKTSSTKKI